MKNEIEIKKENCVNSIKTNLKFLDYLQLMKLDRIIIGMIKANRKK